MYDQRTFLCKYVLISSDGGVLMDSDDIKAINEYKTKMYGGKSCIFKNTPKHIEQARAWVRSSYYPPRF